MCPSGAKDDPRDADLLMDILTQHRKRLRPLKPDTVETRTLQLLTENRRALVDEKTSLTNSLTGALKLYFPQVVQWFDRVDSPLVGALLERWPTLDVIQSAALNVRILVRVIQGCARACTNVALS